MTKVEQYAICYFNLEATENELGSSISEMQITGSTSTTYTSVISSTLTAEVKTMSVNIQQQPSQPLCESEASYTYEYGLQKLL